MGRCNSLVSVKEKSLFNGRQNLTELSTELSTFLLQNISNTIVDNSFFVILFLLSLFIAFLGLSKYH